MARSPQTESGTVEYGGRAFHQDATEAMRGDVVRGIIELVTNSDDAYIHAGEGRQGKIIIEVEHRRNQPSQLIVRDRAGGMRAADLRERITKLGQRTSGFERGLDVRGNLGRGAKDIAAFGEVLFRSVKDGRYSELALHPNGTWELPRERDVTQKDLSELGVKASGTVVQITVAQSIRVPRHDNLKHKLATHYQLRPILADLRRVVELVNLNDGTRDKLVYSFPNLETVFEGDVTVDGYPEAKAHLTLWRHPERSDEPPSDPGRASGVLVTGKRAAYENTLFSLEGNVHAGWFSGKLACEQIDVLARDYDEQLERGAHHDARNPMPIISRRRDGLVREHPFVKALIAAAERPLAELVAKEADRARDQGAIESDRTRAALDRVARELGKMFAEELRDIEAEDIPGPETGLPPLVAVLPEQAFAYIGEDRTLTVVVRADGLGPGALVRIEVDPGGVVELLTPEVLLHPHARREDVLVGQIRLRPLLEGEATMVTATIGDHSASAIIEVRASREEIEEPILPPETLQFERPSYRVGWQRRKDLVLVAPAEAVAEHGNTVTISSSDPGIVVRGSRFDLRYADDVEYYRTIVSVEARVLNAKATITASMGDLAATTHVSATRKEEGPSFRIRIEDDEWGYWRATVDIEPGPSGSDVRIIKIAGRHRPFDRYLGRSATGSTRPSAGRLSRRYWRT